MARISGINLPPNKHIEIALTSIYGIGKVRAHQICDGAGVVRTTKVRELSDQDAESLRARSVNMWLKATFGERSQ